MKYKYRFCTESVDVDIDPKWVSVLNDLDREERNGNIRPSRMDVHYEALGYEPEFMGKKDEELLALFTWYFAIEMYDSGYPPTPLFLQ